MNLNKIYRKAQKGTASEKEISFLREEAEKLRKINLFLDEYNEESEKTRAIVPESKFAEADIETIKRARKKFNSKMLVKTVIISICSSILLAAIICGIIFIPSISSAKRNENIKADEAIELARAFLADHVEDVSEWQVYDLDKELEISGHLNNAYYIYEVEFRNDSRDEYQIDVNAKSGYVILNDIDIYRK